MTAAFTPRRIGLVPPQRRVAVGAVAPSQSARLGHYVPSNPKANRKVEPSDQFWLKGQYYSLGDMLNYDELAEQFYGGTVYQAFLSALSYHGGSTHCLIFRKETELEFFSDLRQGWYNTPVNIDATNVPVRAQIAKAFAKDL